MAVAGWQRYEEHREGETHLLQFDFSYNPDMEVAGLGVGEENHSL